MLLSFETGFNLVNATVVCVTLEGISGLNDGWSPKRLSAYLLHCIETQTLVHAEI